VPTAPLGDIRDALAILGRCPNNSDVDTIMQLCEDAAYQTMVAASVGFVVVGPKYYVLDCAGRDRSQCDRIEHTNCRPFLIDLFDRREILQPLTRGKVVRPYDGEVR
jgi:hypothetical protein